MAVAGAVHRGGCFGVGTCQWSHRAVRVADSVAAVAAGRRRPGPGRRGSPAAGQHKRCGRRGAAESARRASWELGTDHSHKILFFGVVAGNVTCTTIRGIWSNPYERKCGSTSSLAQLLADCLSWLLRCISIPVPAQPMDLKSSWTSRKCFKRLRSASSGWFVSCSRK